MNTNELQDLWRNSSAKLERTLSIGRRNTEEITRMKAHNMLSSMKPIKIFSLVIGIIWVVAVGFVILQLFLNAYDSVSLYFLYSGAIQVLLTAIALAIYIYQLDLIYKTDFSEPVLQLQESLSKLKASTLHVARVLFLQLPVWTTFYLSEGIFENGSLILLIMQGAITLLFTVTAVWLFVNIKYENRNKRWFKWIFGGKEWQPILESFELLNQIEGYRNETMVDTTGHA